MARAGVVALWRWWQARRGRRARIQAAARRRHQEPCPVPSAEVESVESRAAAVLGWGAE